MTQDAFVIPQCLVQQQLCSTATYDDSVKSSLESMQILTLFRPQQDLSALVFFSFPRKIIATMFLDQKIRVFWVDNRPFFRAWAMKRGGLRSLRVDASQYGVAKTDTRGVASTAFAALISVLVAALEMGLSL